MWAFLEGEKKPLHHDEEGRIIFIDPREREDTEIEDRRHFEWSAQEIDDLLKCATDVHKISIVGIMNNISLSDQRDIWYIPRHRHLREIAILKHIYNGK